MIKSNECTCSFLSGKRVSRFGQTVCTIHGFDEEYQERDMNGDKPIEVEKIQLELTALREKVRNALFELQQSIDDLCRLRDKFYPMGFRNAKEEKQ